jgi:CheY-like chemotaxis protein
VATTGARTTRVLLIEDYVDSAEAARSALAAQGHTVEVAATGREGLEKARTFQPDVIVCDLGLPDIDGFEVARLVRGDPRLASVLLIALTGYPVRAQASAAGFDEYLSKPADLTRLAQLIADGAPSRDRRGLDRPSRGRSPPTPRPR